MQVAASEPADAPAEKREPRPPENIAARPAGPPDPTDQAGPMPDSPVADLARLQEILKRASEFNATHPNYICRLTRIERLRGTLRSPEVILMKFRLNPRSVFLEWLDDQNEGRECLYVQGKFNGKMISRGGKGDLLLAGKQLRLDPNGSLARSKSSQPITESGLDILVGKIQARLDRLKKGDKSVGELAIYRGPDKENGQEYDWIVHTCSSGGGDDLPEGGHHRWGFRTDNGRIEIVRATDPRGQLAYEFRFDRFIPVANMTDDEFDPDTLWPKKQAERPASEEEKVVLSQEEELQ